MYSGDGSSWDPAVLAQIIQCYEAGLSIREVAAELGLPKTTAQNALAKSEVVMRPARRVSKKPDVAPNLKER